MTIITAISLFQSCKPITGRNFPVSRRQTFILCGCSAIRQDAHLNFDVGFNLHKLAPRRGDGGTFWESYGDALLVDRAQRSTCRLFSFFFKSSRNRRETSPSNSTWRLVCISIFHENCLNFVPEPVARGANTYGSTGQTRSIVPCFCKEFLDNSDLEAVPDKSGYLFVSLKSSEAAAPVICSHLEAKCRPVGH